MSQPMPSAASAPQDDPKVAGSWTLSVQSCVSELNSLNVLDITTEESDGHLRGSVADITGPDQLLKRDLHDARFDPAPDLKFTVILELLPPRIYTFTGSYNAGTNSMGGTIDGPSCRQGYDNNEEVGTWTATAQPGQVPVE